MIGNRQVSPVELVDACIARIEAVNPFVNAMAAVDYEAARAAARAAENAVMQREALGVLHGLPLGVKDLEATAGLRTTLGSPIYKDFVPIEDGLVVARLRSAGAIVVGKTNVPELGAGGNTRNPVWGATGNPFNPTLTAGGSSGGSAAALACDMLPLCTGSDTGGSLRVPASVCGVVGFRPSPGLVPSPRKVLGWTPISVLGPMGRNVPDTRLQLAACAGMDSQDPLSYPVSIEDLLRVREVDLSSLKVGWTEDFGICAVDEQIVSAFRAKIDAMSSLFGQCERITVDLRDSHRAFDVIRAESFVAGLRDMYEKDPDSLGPNPRANYEAAATMTLGDAAWAHHAQTEIMRRFQQLYRHFDVILSPTTPLTPFPWENLFPHSVSGEAQTNYYRWLSLTYVITLCTNPVVTLPCGVDRSGMPFGLQVIGPFRNDARTLDIAQAMESAFASNAALSRPRPDLQGLATTGARAQLKSIVTSPPDARAQPISGERKCGTSLV
nr:amidase family protein [Paraburkholderia youngii]